MVAYNVQNWGTIPAGGILTVNYTWNNGGYGAQWAQGSPENSDAPLAVGSHTMVKDESGNMIYGFELYNWGRNDTPYDLDGGSVGP